MVGGTTAASGIATTGAYQAARSGTSDAMVFALAALPNSAPVLSGAVQPAGIAEDSQGTGFTVASLIAGKVSDPDAGALSGIAVTAVDDSHGTWEYTLDGSTWTAFGAVAGGSARLLAADATTSIRFVPDANWNGPVPGFLGQSAL